jgi:hypothetical protein
MREDTLDRPVDVARPFVWTAAWFFSLGFCGYLALSPLVSR